MPSHRSIDTRPGILPPPMPVDPTSARALVDTFFDALGHFAGERPALEELSRVLAPCARIVDLGDEDEPDDEDGDASTSTESCFPRNAWLARLADSAEQRRSAGHGHFFEELERTVTTSASELVVGSVVEERVTHDEHVEHAQLLQCSLVVRSVDGAPSIVEVRVRRSSRPPLR